MTTKRVHGLGMVPPSEFVFEDAPPSRGKSGSVLDEQVAALAAHPGKWVKVRTGKEHLAIPYRQRGLKVKTISREPGSSQVEIWACAAPGTTLILNDGHIDVPEPEPTPSMMSPGSLLTIRSTPDGDAPW